METNDTIAIKIKITQDGAVVIDRLTSKIHESTRKIDQNYTKVGKTLKNWLQTNNKTLVATAGSAKANQNLSRTLTHLGTKTKTATTRIKTWSDHWDIAQEKIALTRTILNSLTTLLDALGVKLNKTATGLLNLANAAGQIAAGIASKNPAQVIGGVVNAIGSFIGILKKEIDWAGRAEKALQGLSGVTGEMKERLAELAEEIGSTRRAFNQLLAEMIEGAVTGEKTFNQWAGEVLNLIKEIGLSPNPNRSASIFTMGKVPSP